MDFQLIEHGVVDSTSERAFAAIHEQVARHGDVHVATAQSAGRGRLGRAWHSAPGEGLYASIVLFPGPPPLSPPGLTMAAGLAVLDTVRKLGLDSAQLKWPNDVVVPLPFTQSENRSDTSRPRTEAEREDAPTSKSPRAAKLSGVLVETRGLDPERPHYVVGIGINVAQRQFPPVLEHERPVTSFALCGVDVPVGRVRDELLAQLGPRLESIRTAPAQLCADFLDAARLARARIRVSVGETTIAGELLEMSLDEGLRIRLDDGRVQRVAIEFVRELTV